MTEAELDSLVRWNNRLRYVQFFPKPKFNSTKEKFKAKCKCFFHGHKYEYNGDSGAIVLGTHSDMHRYTCIRCGKDKLSFTY